MRRPWRKSKTASSKCTDTGFSGVAACGPLLLCAASVLGCVAPAASSGRPDQDVSTTTGTVLIQTAEVIAVRESGITVRFINGGRHDYRTADYDLHYDLGRGPALQAGDRVQVITNNRNVRITR
jgi:hypothetical protein